VLLKPAEKLPSLAGSSDPWVNSGTKKIISYFPSWIWSTLGSASLEKQKEAVSSAAKTELGNERCLQPWPILSKQDGENVRSLPAEAPGGLSYRTTCSAEPCRASLRAAGWEAWPCSRQGWLIPHTK